MDEERMMMLLRLQRGEASAVEYWLRSSTGFIIQESRKFGIARLDEDLLQECRIKILKLGRKYDINDPAHGYGKTWINYLRRGLSNRIIELGHRRVRKIDTLTTFDSESYAIEAEPSKRDDAVLAEKVVGAWRSYVSSLPDYEREEYAQKRRRATGIMPLFDERGGIFFDPLHYLGNDGLSALEVLFDGGGWNVVRSNLGLSADGLALLKAHVKRAIREESVL